MNTKKCGTTENVILRTLKQKKKIRIILILKYQVIRSIISYLSILNPLYNTCFFKRFVSAKKKFVKAIHCLQNI